MTIELSTNPDMIDALLTRRSVTAKDLCEPGPNDMEINTILRAAHRVPDHKKLGPWRFILFRDQQREKFSEQLAEILENQNPNTTPQVLAFERKRFLQAPLVIAVVSSPVKNEKAPEWEQVLSAGAACQNILLAAKGLGYGAQWLSEWYCYNANVHELMGLDAHEKIAGFMYVGSIKKIPKERDRPELESRVSEWKHD